MSLGDRISLARVRRRARRDAMRQPVVIEATVRCTQPGASSFTRPGEHEFVVRIEVPGGSPGELVRALVNDVDRIVARREER